MNDTSAQKRNNQTPSIPSSHLPLPSTSTSETRPLLHHDERPSFASTHHEIDDDGSSEGNRHRALTIVKSIFTLKLFGVMFCFFISGLSTTGIGALISGIESYYNLSDGPTAIIFPTGVAGYLTATLLLPWTLSKFGWRGIALVTPSLRLISTMILSAGLSFPITLVGFYIYGYAVGLADSGFCAWGSKIAFANITQGFMHGSFSIGAVTGPIFAQAISKRGSEWYSFYRLLAILSCIEFFALGAGFRKEHSTGFQDAPVDVSDEYDEPAQQTKHPLKMMAVWICGFFFLIYVGVESSYSDWAIEYMKRVRHLDPDIASFSTSSFWIGMTFGRLSLGPVTERFGLSRCVSVYIVLSTLFQILFKWTQDAAASLVLLGANGFFLGPMFPSGVILLATKVSPQSNIGAIAAVAAMGQVGGASAPLAIGILADGFGIGRMLDVVLGLSVLLLFMWLAFCRFESYRNS